MTTGPSLYLFDGLAPPLRWCFFLMFFRSSFPEEEIFADHPIAEMRRGSATIESHSPLGRKTALRTFVALNYRCDSDTNGQSWVNRRAKMILAQAAVAYQKQSNKVRYIQSSLQSDLSE